MLTVSESGLELRILELELQKLEIRSENRIGLVREGFRQKEEKGGRELF